MIRFNLNGAWVEARDVAPTTTVLRYLRDTLGLSGTKEGCAEGDCGACTIAVVEQGVGGPEYRAVNSCLLLLPMVHGKHVVTVEGLAKGEPHPAQHALADALGSQCGYCTPGVVMTMFEATYRKDLDAPWKLDDQLCGNLCRCTGYRPIREAAQQVAGTCPADAFSAALPSQAPVDTALQVTHEGQRFTTPATFAALWDELDAYPDARFVVGGTDLSLEITKRFQAPPRLISLEALPSLRELSVQPDGVLRLGATATIAELEAFTATRASAIHRMVRYFGARQIKHRGTIGGNLCTASPIGDLAPVFLSLGATAILRSRAGERRVPLDAFFVSYRKTALAPKEVLAAIEVPATPATARSVAYKVSKRRELDISTVSAGLYVDTDAAGVVTVARFAFGGVAATPKRATAAERAVVGKPWTREGIATAAKLLADDLTPLSDHRGSAAYRSLVARNLLLGFYDETLTVRQPALQPGHTATVQPQGAP